MSVQKRGSRYLVRWQEGDRHRGKMFTRKADAQAWELEKRREAEMGAFAPSSPSRRTLNDFLDEWFASESVAWSAATRLQRRHSLDRWVRPYVGQLRLADLGTRRVRQWRSEIRDAGATPSVINHAHGVFSAALGCAVENGLLPANPFAGMRKLSVMVGHKRAL